MSLTELAGWARRARNAQAAIDQIVPRPGTVWHCPRCGTELEPDGLELWCPACGEQIPWTELGGGF